ncbi:pyrroline-5-carboxylate reductase [Campylobacter sp. 19-13652]|uniref:pyrroline-5-carboxylate reductase n=1 Tax=Campylobacter sp. 19-13652 TaxID=2840180 RepID=UPI001C768BEC|nr:pyrroline-5-carboxylate reductase [Campylobacter sp. 19-13652]BCX78561.1 pyrroline-5-carboxylate reductase [Campylobacter sp. 19-13652]
MRVGIVGLGSMGIALLRGAIGHGEYEFIVYDRNEPKRAEARELGAQVASNALEVASACDIFIVAVKPNGVSALLASVCTSLDLSNALVISLAAGVGLDEVKSALSGYERIALAMPNTPAKIKQGVSALVFSETLDELAQSRAIKFFKTFGLVQVISQAQMPAFIAIAGSLPAYVCLFIEALSDAAVASGMSREAALKIASNAVCGSAAMIASELSSGTHPAQLKDAVCSPAGTTIAAIRELEARGFRSAVIEGALAAAKKAQK